MHGTYTTVIEIINRTYKKTLHPTVDHRSYIYFPSHSVVVPLLGYGEHKLSRSPFFFLPHGFIGTAGSRILIAEMRTRP